MSRLRVLDLPADRLEAEVVVAFFFVDRRPVTGPAALLDWRLDDPLTRLLVAGRCAGRFGEQLLVADNGKLHCDWVLFAGGGPAAELDSAGYRHGIGRLARVCEKAGFRRIGLALEPLRERTQAGVAALVAEALADSSLDGEYLLVTDDTLNGP